jgi:hypothetical protein
VTSADVDVPGIGNVKKQYVYAGGALVVGIAGYAWFKQRGSSSTAAPVLNPNDVVPATGFNPAPTGDATQTVDGTAGLITTNAQWTQKATEMMAQYGFDPILASTALGKYLTRTGLSPSEIEVVQRAIGLLGYPPVGGPWAIIPGGASAGGGTMKRPGNLHVNKTSGGAQIVWDADAATDQYRVEVRSRPTSHLFQANVAGPHGVITTGTFFPSTDKGITRDVTVTPSNSSGDGPSATVTYTS